MPQYIRTEEGLLARLTRAAKGTLTSDQIRRQRISFIHGTLPRNSHMSPAQIEDVLDKHEGTKAA